MRLLLQFAAQRHVQLHMHAMYIVGTRKMCENVHCVAMWVSGAQEDALVMTLQQWP